MEHVGTDIWLAAADPTVGLEGIHAMILLCTWPLPTIRFMTDPSTVLANVALTASMLLGLHTGKGSHGEFCLGLRNHIEATDEEASTTWLASCYVAQRFGMK